MVRDVVTTAFEVVALVLIVAGAGLEVARATGHTGVGLLVAGVLAMGAAWVVGHEQKGERR
ncbi:hypothetical protein KMZ30_07330 [Phycicoccus sp. KQZ13P-1]|uniref:hypothetical protein n=1 Tax=Phycicoccus mangrovi TaxID=2840470 RepID=UPI001BFFFCF8|nr:hypothetical protein [Phycicoccus mangrovi]MBT9255383.1 hypothetical protein [Phycicoccus mangrovi]